MGGLVKLVGEPIPHRMLGMKQEHPNPDPNPKPDPNPNPNPNPNPSPNPNPNPNPNPDQARRAEERARSEACLLARAAHPNVVALLGFSDDGPAPCLVLGLMPGGSLQVGAAPT